MNEEVKVNVKIEEDEVVEDEPILEADGEELSLVTLTPIMGGRNLFPDRP